MNADQLLTYWDIVANFVVDDSIIRSHSAQKKNQFCLKKAA